MSLDHKESPNYEEPVRHTASESEHTGLSTISTMTVL